MNIYMMDDVCLDVFALIKNIHLYLSHNIILETCPIEGFLAICQHNQDGLCIITNINQICVTGNMTAPIIIIILSSSSLISLLSSFSITFINDTFIPFVDKTIKLSSNELINTVNNNKNNNNNYQTNDNNNNVNKSIGINSNNNKKDKMLLG